MGAAALRLACYALLLILLAASAAATQLPLGNARIAFHIGAAVAQALLIFVVYMNLRSSPPLVRILAAAGVLWLLILFGFTFLDYSHRVI